MSDLTAPGHAPGDPTGEQGAAAGPPRDRRRARLYVVAAALLALVLAVPLAYRASYQGRVYPRVTAGGVGLSGLDDAKLESTIAAELPMVAGPITLRDPVDGRSWTMSPSELGVVTAPEEVAALALAAGRSGRFGGAASLLEPLAILVLGHEVLPDGLTIDGDRARAALIDLAPEVDVAPIDAELRLDEGGLVGREPQLGRQLDVEATLMALLEHAATPAAAELQIAVRETAPRVGDPTGVRLAYEKTVSAPVHVVWEDSVHEVIDVDQLTRWADVEYAPNEAGVSVPTIMFDYESMREWVAPLADRVNRSAEGARFSYDTSTGAVGVIGAGRSGITLDVEGTMTRIVEAAYSDDRTATVAVVLSRPEVSNDDLPRLRGVEEMVQASSSIAGAPESRIRNMLLALERFNGLALPPGKQFSFNQALGPVTADGGYEMAVIDVSGGASEPSGTGPGTNGSTDLVGGIDQLAAMAFRAAFWAGLPIVERNAPSVRSGWVEPPVGLDAAVDGQRRDLQFRNDTDGYLLIQARLDGAKAALIWTVYGQPDGRLVATSGPTVTDIAPAPEDVVTVDDDRLPPGERQQAGWAREGATVDIERRVTKNGVVLSEERFRSDYSPGSDVVVVGRAR